jgi:hypothetical protein
LKFIGYERVEYCWAIQEWVCELQYEPPVSDAAIRTRYGLPAIPAAAVNWSWPPRQSIA